MSVLLYRLNCLENILKILVKDTDKRGAEKAGEFNKMIGSKALKHNYIQETDQVYQNLAHKPVMNRGGKIEKRSKDHFYKRMVEVEEEKMKGKIEEEIDIMQVNMHTETEKLSSKREKLRDSFSNIKYKHFNNPEIPQTDPRMQSYTGSVANLALPELIGTDNIITNFYKLKGTLLKLQKKKEDSEKTEKINSRNSEINRVIDEYSARTRSRLVSPKIS